MNDWISRLREEFKKPLPGEAAQLMMSPKVRRPVATESPAKKSGVLLLLYPREDSIFTVFIKRTEYEGFHSGQISFPGGMYEESDDSLAGTALRETMEETGMPVDEAVIIGNLTPLHIPVSNNVVFPYVALSSKRPAFVHDPSEVQYLIETSIHELLNPVNCKRKMMSIAGNEFEVPYFDIRNNHIWGATAMILSEFLEIIRRITG